MKIAILYICTGKYDIFWNEFYHSCKEKFCVDEDNHFFVFTDSKQIHTGEDVSIIYQDNLGWPFNTLYRYKMFLRVQEQLAKFDKIVFFNGNCIFVDEIVTEDFFGIESKLVAGLHPGFFNKSYDEYTYEKRKNSTAFVVKPWKYFAGGVNGGDSQLFVEICHKISENIDNDLKNGIVAIWHDESHWNAYLNNNYEMLKDQLHILSPKYLYPEGWSLPFEPKIILRDKKNYGGHHVLRGKSETEHGIKQIFKFIAGVFKCK